MPARLVNVGRGRYKVRWRSGVRDPITKRYVEHSTGVLAIAEAKAEKRRLDTEQRVRRELRRGTTSGRILSLDAILTLWRESARADDVTEGYTTDKWLVFTALFAERGWTSTVSVTADSVSTWLRERGGRGTEKPLRQLKTLLRYAAGVLRQPVDPHVLMLGGGRRTRRASPALLQPHEVHWLLALAQVRGGDESYWLVEHLATYGCRPIDLCRLNLGDFDAAASTVRMRETKNRKTVVAPVLPRHATRYAAHQAARYAEGDTSTDAFFRNPHGERWRISKRGQALQLRDWYTDNVSEWLLPKAQTGIYLLKDFAITEMDRAGVDDRTKALFTGHLDLSVFQRYKSTNDQRARAALPGIGRALGATEGISA